LQVVLADQLRRVRHALMFIISWSLRSNPRKGGYPPGGGTFVDVPDIREWLDGHFREEHSCGVGTYRKRLPRALARQGKA
jgi:hypothetical protein